MKYALALAGGGTKGAAYFGFFETLEEEIGGREKLKEVISALALTSSASLFVPLYLIGFNFQRFLEEHNKTKIKRLLYFSPLHSNKDIYQNILKKYFGDMKVKDLPLRTYILSLDLNTTKIYSNVNMKLVDAVYASTSHPLLFPVLEYRRKRLVDPGALELIACKFLKDKGYKPVIGIRLVKGIKRESYNNQISLLFTFINLFGLTVREYNASFCDECFFLLEHKFSSFSTFESLNFLESKTLTKFYLMGKKNAKRIIKRLLKS